MSQPQWITPAGNLGTIPEGVFYQYSLLADTPVIDSVTVTAASSTNNRFTCASTAGFYAGLNVIFSSPNNRLFGGVSAYVRYFVLEVFNSTEFSITTTEFSTTPITLSDGTGSMTADFTQHVYYRVIAGQLPEGIQVSDNGLIEGLPKAVASLQGVPTEVSEDVTSRFAIRAYTTVPGTSTVDRINDRTFSLTVTGQDLPEFVTPSGSIGTYYDGSEVNIEIQWSDSDLDDQIRVNLVSGTLPPGLVLAPRTGIISGVIEPLTGPPGTAISGYDATQYDQYPWDFSTRSTSKNFQFGIEITDGKDSNVRMFEIFVYSKDSMSADTTDFTADNTFITADIIPTRTPILLTPQGSLGILRADNFYAFKFDAIDFDGDPIEYSVTLGPGLGYDASGTVFDENGVGFDQGTFALPPGLQIDSNTGWFYGYVPDQGITESTYKFAIRVLKANNPSIISDFYYFTITIAGDITTQVTWITPEDLGIINNGAVSTLAVEAVNAGGQSLQYRLASGTDSRLPQGLTLQPSGHITGRVSFNTFCLDGGVTTFDANVNTRLQDTPTTFDLRCTFTVNAFAAQTEQIGYRVNSIQVSNGGTGYVSQPTITISAPPNTENAIQATAGVATIVGGVITEIAIGNPGQGYITAPTITISGGGGTGAEASAQIIASNLINAVSVFRTFTVLINREFNEPYETLYIKAMPPYEDRAILSQLLQNQDVIPESLVYRSDDANFGVAKSVIYDHAYGLTASRLQDYVDSLDLNHYWKDITLGPIRTAQALAPDGSVLYEVVYSEIIDNLVNNQGVSVGKSVTLPFDVDVQGTETNVVYPNSLINMRDQVIDTVGQISPALPLWMTSKQADGRVLGFVPAWVIVYVQPGQSGRVAYSIRENFGQQLNLIDFEVDRYELDRSQTRNWDPVTDQWIPSPPLATTFDASSRPSELVDLGEVDYATTLPWIQIDHRPLDYITALGGIDGETGRQLNGRSLIFLQQENFGNGLTPDQAFTDSIETYDDSNYDATGTEYDESVVIPQALRLAIYTINVDVDNLVTLTLQEQTDVNDYVKVTRGRVYNNTQFYLPLSPTPGLVLRTWSYIPDAPLQATIFDGGSTRFIAPADRWLPTDEFNKYLVFPKRTILG